KEAGAGHGAFDDIVDVDLIARLRTVGEDARAVAGEHLRGELVDHAGHFALAGFAGAEDVEVAEADDPGAGAIGAASGIEAAVLALHEPLAEAVDVIGAAGGFQGEGDAVTG